MTLQDIFPENKLREMFSQNISVFRFGIDELNTIVEEKSEGVFQAGARSWDRFVHVNHYPDPRQLVNHFIEQNPFLYQEVSKVVGSECLHDIAYIKAVVDDEKLADPKSSELLIANIYPGELHILDIQLLDPYKPIYPQKHFLQPFKGLRLMHLVVENCKKYCHENGINTISLMAAEKSLVPVFEQHGFNVENSPTAEIGLKHGMSIPMVLAVN